MWKLIKNVEKSLAATFTGDTNLCRMVKTMSLTATEQLKLIWGGKKRTQTVFYFQQVSDTKLQLQLYRLRPIKLLYTEGFRKLQ